MLVPGSASPLLFHAPAGGGVTAGRSIRLNAPDSAYLSRTPASAGNRKTWTWSGWVKRGKLNASIPLFGCGTPGSDYLLCRLRPGDTIGADQYGTANNFSVETTAVYRDPSAWYHIVFAFDTTQGTNTNRVKLYVNGVQQTLNAAPSWPGSSVDLLVNSTIGHTIGADLSGFGGGYGDYYLALVHFIDGQALTPSSFGETSATTGQWIAKTYSGTYGTNGFFLDFSDNSGATSTTLGKDAAGSNNWTPNNLSVTAGSGNDSLRDHPTSAGTSTGLGGEVSGNYCTWNPLNSSTYTFANGNLEATGYAGNSQMVSTIGVSSGKWYCEISLSGSGGTSNAGIGISKGEQGTYPGELSTSYGYFGSASKINAGSVTSYGATYTYGDIIGIALDMDAGTCTMYKNGSSQGQLASGLSGTYFIAVRNSSNAGDKTIANFGQRAWAYACPSGFSPLVDTLLPTPTIAKPNTVMDVKLYTGNGSTQTISGLGFSPDLVWLKSRSNALNHRLIDQVQGNTSTLASNLTTASVDCSSDFTGFTSDGFTLNQTASFELNKSSATYVAWTWDAGSSNATNTSGTITSTVRANISAGFSIVTYTGNGTAGATIGHGLGVKPSLLICKDRDDTTNWIVQHVSTGATQRLELNTTGAAAAVSTLWNDTEPTSTVFTVGTNGGTNDSGEKYVVYAWAPVAGYSAFGSYTGNGSSDGPCVATSFAPKWIMIKATTDPGGGVNWTIQDRIRSPYNYSVNRLYANSGSAEDGNTAYPIIDFLSNGFKIRNNFQDYNSSGVTYIYACFAESPLAYARAR